MRVSTFFIFLFCVMQSKNAKALSLGDIKNKTEDIFKLGAKTGEGLIKKVPDLIPTPENVFNVGKQTLIGLPFELLLSTIDKICSIALAANNGTEPYKQPSISEMNYVLITNDDNVSIPITESKKLWLHPKFDAKKNVVVMVTGWNSDINDTNTAAEMLSSSYLKRGDTNFVLIDTARYVDTLYAWSAFNTQELGEGLGKGLAELIEYVPLEKIHVMGHSLGAHIVGAAGRTFQIETNGKMLPRITGFDPAKPCFREGETLNGLARGDADFVDIIHSDAGALGKSDPIGDADFYPNGIVSLMPGCLTIFCSHSRAWEYFAETVVPGNENNLLAKKCGSLHSYEINACLRDEVAMGFSCPKNIKGNFFLKTNGEAPFGKKQEQKDSTKTDGTDTKDDKKDENLKNDDRKDENSKKDDTKDENSKKDESKKDSSVNDKTTEKPDQVPDQSVPETSTIDPPLDVRAEMGNETTVKSATSSSSDNKPFPQIRDFAKSVASKIF